MPILPPQSYSDNVTECDEEFWRSASTRMKAQPKPNSETATDADGAWAAFGDYLWSVPEVTKEAAE